MMTPSSKKRLINTRPLTKSEKILLGLLLLVVLVWVSNRFIFQPQAAKLTSLEAEKADYELQIIDINDTLKSEEKIRDQWDELDKERSQILSQYFPTLDQSQIIYLLNDLINEENFNVDDLSFSRPTTAKLGEMDVRNMEASFPFEGGYNGVIDILNSFQTSPRRILIDSLSIDSSESDDLSGSMALKIYSLEGIAETDPNVIFVETADGSGDSLPFESYDDFTTASTAGDSPSGISVDEDGEIVLSPDIKVGMRKQLLHEFDYSSYNFIPSSPMVKGNVSPSNIRKSGRYSMRFEFNILALEEENRAYVDLSSTDIEFKVPPTTIGTWIYSYGYSPGTLGMRLVTQDGVPVDFPMVNGLTWTGWNYVETSPPSDLTLYPLRLDKIYYELPFNRDDFGVMLIDKMEAFYSDSDEEIAAGNQETYLFYVVEAGDNISEISRKMYGTMSYKNEIMQLNDIRAGEVLPVGKVLVLKRH